MHQSQHGSVFPSIALLVILRLFLLHDPYQTDVQIRTVIASKCIRQEFGFHLKLDLQHGSVGSSHNLPDSDIDLK